MMWFLSICAMKYKLVNTTVNQVIVNFICSKIHLFVYPFPPFSLSIYHLSIHPSIHPLIHVITTHISLLTSHQMNWLSCSLLNWWYCLLNNKININRTQFVRNLLSDIAWLNSPLILWGTPTISTPRCYYTNSV